MEKIAEGVKQFLGLQPQVLELTSRVEENEKQLSLFNYHNSAENRIRIRRQESKYTSILCFPSLTCPWEQGRKSTFPL